MVACRYRWLAAFLPFIDIKKAKSIISVLCLRIFRLMKKQTHDVQSSKSQQPTSWDFYFQIVWYNSGKHEEASLKNSCDINN